MNLLLNFDKLNSVLQELANSDYWQIIYNQSKECNGLGLFNNKNDYTNLQVQFLCEIAFYSSLHYDIAMGEVSPLVLKKHIYAESYAFYKKNKDKKKMKVQAPEINTTYHKNVEKQEIKNVNQWVFTKVKG